MIAHVAVVTGAASGIGLATANRLASEGWRLALADLDGEAVAAAIDFDPAGHVIHSTDISDPAAVDHLFTESRRALGPPNAVANVAGITLQADARLEDVSLETFDRVIGVNLRGTFLMCRRALPELRAAGGGTIVNVGSVASVRGLGGAAYVASKHGLAGLTRHIAYRYAHENIRSVLVAPGPTATPMIDVARSKAGGGPVTALPGVIPRDATAAEVASLVVYLMGVDAGMVSGTVFAVDGGLSQF
jgi:NAD(P)-dependent dehydrogenase (short-subunit alcohol dehydrogenase family)